MRFTHQELHGLGDAQQNFEQLQALTILGYSIAVGQAVLTFAAAAGSASITVTHGLTRGGRPVAPTIVVASSFNAGAFGQIPNCNTFTYTTSTFMVNGETKNAFTGSTTINWIAVA